MPARTLPALRPARRLAWPIAALALCTGAAAQDPGIEHAVVARVQAFLIERAAGEGDEVEVEVFPSAAGLPPCTAPEPFLPPPGQRVHGRVAVGVRCAGEPRHVRYLQAEVRINGRYWVAARDLAAGEVVTADAVHERRGELSALPRDIVRTAEEVVGRQAQRQLAADTPLQTHQFRAVPLVERGQRVIVEARGERFHVRREGTALEPGGRGERVRVRFGKDEIVHAEVVDAGLLAIPF